MDTLVAFEYVNQTTLENVLQFTFPKENTHLYICVVCKDIPVFKNANEYASVTIVFHCNQFIEESKLFAKSKKLNYLYIARNFFLNPESLNTLVSQKLDVFPLHECRDDNEYIQFTHSLDNFSVRSKYTHGKDELVGIIKVDTCKGTFYSPYDEHIYTYNNDLFIDNTQIYGHFYKNI